MTIETKYQRSVTCEPMKLDHWSKVHTVNPYEGFPLAQYPADLTGWHSDDPIFDQLIKEVRPELVVEVGVWKGASTLHMANRLFFNGLHQSRILACDTWLGSLEFWTKRDDPERYGALKCEHGFPTVYRQFIANVLHHNREDVIIPFPNTSLTCARWFRMAGFQADLIYLDGSHEREDVMDDLEAWWDNLRPGGILFGDDHATFLGVSEAVAWFFRKLQNDGLLNVRLYVQDNKWVIHKP